MRWGRPGGIVVLKVIGTLARLAFGFALASIAAGLVTVLFVNTPADVLAQPVEPACRKRPARPSILPC